MTLRRAAVRSSRESGALGHLPIALVYRAGVHINAGEFSAAVALVEEANSITDATGYAPLGYASALLIGWRGDDEKAQVHLEWAVVNAKLRGEGRAVAQNDYMSAILHNGHGRYDEALASARAACEHDDLGVRGFALVELIEAAVRGASPEIAAEAVRELEERAVAVGTDWALGMLARSRALLATGQAAEAFYLEAIERLGRCRVVVHLARAHLLYGEWLRRENRRRDAGSNFESLMTPSTRWAPTRSPSVPVVSCSRLARPPASAPPRRVRTSPRRKRRSPAWWPTDTRTRRSAASSSSAHEPSSITSARCSRSSG